MSPKRSYEELEQRIQALEKAKSDLKSALHKSEQEFKSIIENIEDGYYEVDIAGNFILFNDSLCKILRYSKKELTGLNNRRYMDKENAKIVYKAFNRVYKTGQSHKAFNWELVRKDGTRCYIEASVALKRDSRGQLIGFQGFARDITKRKHAEDGLLREKRFSEILISQLPGSFYMFTESGRMIRWNDNLEKVTGFSSEEIKQMNALDFFPADEKEKVYQRIKEVFIAGASHVEANFLTKDGHKIPHVLSGSKVEYDGISYLLGVGLDITERKQIEIAQRESEEKFRVITEESPLGVSLIDKKGNYKYLNPRFLEMVGYSLEHISTGRDWFKKAFPDKKYRNLVISTWKSDKQRSGIGESRPRTFVVTCHDGSKKTINFKPVTLEAGDQLLIYEDITENKKLEDQLRQAQKMESIGTLAGGVAHDFNNILSPIIGYTEMLLEDIPKESPLRISLMEVLKGALRAKDLVKQILTFSRQTAHEIRPLKIQNILKDVLTLSRSTLPTTIEITQDIQKECGMIMADPTQIHQIVMNLITNAFHAMEESGGILTVGLKEVNLPQESLPESDLRPGPYVCLTIADTGTGMDIQTQERLFEPYFTTKERDKGTGLGLAVVHGIVHVYNGMIEVESILGKGTAFTVFIPRIVSEVETKTEIQPAEFLTGNERILLVDDEEVISEMLKSMLERLGYTVSVRNSSTDTLEAFKAAPFNFDLVITDMTMPNLTGDKLAKKIKTIRPDTPSRTGLK